MYHFCTLFDSSFLTRGLAMYESLRKHCPDFHLYVFAFDEACYAILRRLRLENATVVSLDEFEGPELLAVKPSRSRVEYFWTCTPSIVRYVLDRFEVGACTYLDADIYFWASPAILFAELGDSSVLITEHRYTPKYDHSATLGKYCVQFVTFRNDARANLVLNWWRDSCNAWCFDRVEDGRFGDQKYLDHWPERFDGVHVLKHPGAGVAPWNVQQFDVDEENGAPTCRDKGCGDVFRIIFFHYHHLRFYSHFVVDLGGYQLGRRTKRLLYRPYLDHLQRIGTTLRTDTPRVATHGAAGLKWTDWWSVVRHVKHLCLGNIRLLRGGHIDRDTDDSRAG